MRAEGAIDMKLASARPATQTERIYALEETRKADGKRLDKIETMVAEMHEILVATRTIGRFLRRALTYVGGPSAIGTAALYGWKAFTGH